MKVNEVKHQAKLEQWRQRIAECRSSGVSVKQWCSENGCAPTTYYRWEREIFGRADKAPEPEGEDVVPALPIAQPRLAELVVEPSAERTDHPTAFSEFCATAIVRVGKLELELTNGVSEALMRQLKELVSDA